jgi:hypothetical protein
MGLLMFRCPRTDRYYSTGINIDADDLSAAPDILVAARCPYCKTDHEWRPGEAWLAEPIPLPEPLSAAGNEPRIPQS